jgi:hypothetical protein
LKRYEVSLDFGYFGEILETLAAVEMFAGKLHQVDSLLKAVRASSRRVLDFCTFDYSRTRVLLFQNRSL